MAGPLHASGRYDWERIVRRYPLPPVPKLVAFVLATYADQDGSRIYPGVARLAAVTGLSQRSVKSALGVLRGVGLINRIVSGGHRGARAFADEYALTIPEDLMEAAVLLPPDENPRPKVQDLHLGEGPKVHVTTPQGAGGAPQGASDDTPGCTTCTPPVLPPPTQQPKNQREDHLENATTDRAQGLAENVIPLGRRGSAR